MESWLGLHYYKNSLLNLSGTYECTKLIRQTWIFLYSGERRSSSPEEMPENCLQPPQISQSELLRFRVDWSSFNSASVNTPGDEGPTYQTVVSAD